MTPGGASHRDESVGGSARNSARHAGAGALAIAACAAGAAWFAAPHLPDWFTRYFGPVAPAVGIVALGCIAVLVAPALRRRGFWGAPDGRAFGTATLLAAGFSACIIGVDRLAGFPADMNAPLPWALLYYPAMGFAAQVALHVAPLAAIVSAAPDVARRRPWMVMTASAIPESALQAGAADGALAGVVAVHLLAFGIAEAWLLRRFGFVAMHAFRLVYYLAWHIAWGAARAG